MLPLLQCELQCDFALMKTQVIICRFCRVWNVHGQKQDPLLFAPRFFQYSPPDHQQNICSRAKYSLVTVRLAMLSAMSSVCRASSFLIDSTRVLFIEFSGVTFESFRT